MERAFKCDFCSENFIFQSELNQHMASEYGKAGCAPRKSFKCRVCDRVFANNQNLIRHIRIHTGERPFKCTVDDCEMAFKDSSALKIHIKGVHSDDRPYKCHFPDCKFTAKTSAALITHKKVHCDDQSFACSECDYKTNWSSNLKKHRMRQHSTRRNFECSHPECTKSYKSSVDLKRHFTNHHKVKNIACDHPGCDQKYSNSAALNKHKRDVHAKKSLACPNADCIYRTNSSSQLAHHVIAHNGRNKKISCSRDGCQYKGKNSRAMNDHMRIHKTLLRCPEFGCGHYTKTKEPLKNHTKLHNPLGRPSQCPLCPQRFQLMENLRNHCFSHTNEKPFACGHCEYAAAFQAHVKRHASRAHANVQFPFIVHLLDNRECLNCNVTLPTAEFYAHCEGHVDPVQMEV